MKVMKKKIFLSAVPVIAAAVYFFWNGHGRTAQPAAVPAPAVTVATVHETEIVEWDEFTGRTGPVESVEIRPEVSGYISEVRFQSGQLVRKGDVLFAIDPRWRQADYQRLQAEAERARV